MGSDPDAVAAELTRRTGGEPRRLTRGRWSCEVRGDEIADITFDGVYLLRAIRPVVRDRDWNTVPVRVLDQHLADDGTLVLLTRVRFEAVGPGEGEAIAYEALVELRIADDTLVVRFDGEPLTPFLRNRIGLVVLHPPADAGSAVRVVRSDGGVVDGTWPEQISPHQPFVDVAGFSWHKRGVESRLTLIGDTFETEDQRNWTDASFKTYGTPLSLPFPVPVAPGDTCHQEARLSVTGRAAASGIASRTTAPDEVVVVESVIGTVPPISVGASAFPPPASLWRGPAAFESLLVELTGDPDAWPARLRSAADQAQALRARLDVRLVSSDPGVVAWAVDVLADLDVARLGVFDPTTHLSTAPLWHALASAARRSGVAGDLVGGTRAHFTELNRQIAAIPDAVPALSFSVTPQMHATEIPHILDSLTMQPLVAAAACRLAAGRPVLVGPITLARRFNAVATSGPVDPAQAADRAVDPLQATDLLGAWTLASIAHLSPTPVAGLCYFELTGPRGIVTDDGQLTPAGRVLVRLSGLRGCPILATTGPADLPTLAVGTPEGPIELTVGNLTSQARRVTVARKAGASMLLDLPGWGMAAVTV